MPIKLSKYLEYALKGVLYLILLTPLLVSSRYLFPFITTKTIYFRLLVELAVLLYVVLTLLVPAFKPRFSKLSWAIIILGVIIFLTGITGVDFYKTFWGTIERGEGFLTLSHLIIYFLILTWTLKTKQEWLNYITAAVGIGLLVDWYAILQRAQVKSFFLFGPIIHSGEGRLSATIGNAAFLGAFTLAQFFLSLFLFLQRKHWVWKLSLAGAILINFYVLFQTQTRGALLAWVLVVLSLTLFYSIKSPDKIKKYLGLSILLGILIFSVVVLLNKNSNFVQKNHTLSRLVNISRHDITTESRLMAADSSWRGLKDRFILGYGWENYNIAFNKYFHAEIYKDQGSQLWFDRAHNTIFDVAVATGLIGLISYLTIFGLALYYLFKNLKYDFDFSVILMALLLAHFLQNIFVFDVLSTFILLFLVLAITTALTAPNKSFTLRKSSEHQSTLTEKPKDAVQKNFDYLTFSIALIVVIFMAYLFNVKPLKANVIAVKGLIAASSHDMKQAVIFFDTAIKMKTYQTPEIRQKLADNIIYFNNTKNNLTQTEVYQNFQLSIQVVKDNINEHPEDVQNYLYLMAILNKAGRYDEVVEWGEKALKLSPTRPQTYFEMGQARISQKKYQEGVDYFKKGVELNPKTMESHWNLMAAYILSHEDEKAKAEQILMEKNGYNFNDPNELNRLYNIYLMARQKDKLVEVLEKLTVLEPNGSNYARLAAAYKEISEKEKARAAVKKAVELDPSLKDEAAKFLETLK